MAKVSLVLDCSTANAAWAFIENGKQLAGAIELAPPSASVTVADHLHSLFASRKDLLDRLGAVYVGIGPGSFTGLRVALALSKGLAYAAHAPLIGFSSLESMAFSALAQDGDRKWVLPVIDAKKHEVYAALYQLEDGRLKEILAPAAFDPAALSAQVRDIVKDEPLLLSGTGAYLLDIPGAAKSEAAVSPEGLTRLLGKREIPLMTEEELCNSWNIIPFYARLSEAEIGLINRKNGQ